MNGDIRRAKSLPTRSATPTPTWASRGLERFRNAALNGQTGTNLQTILDQLQGKRPRGDEVLTTLDPKAQQTAITALGEHQGAVVALDPRDGAVKVMVSTPSFDPNKLPERGAYEQPQKTREADRWSTASPSLVMPRARPSRWLQPRRRSTRDSFTSAVHAEWAQRCAWSPVLPLGMTTMRATGRSA